MKKIYILISSWSVDDNGYGYEVLGVFENKEKAEKELNNDLTKVMKLHNLKENALQSHSDIHYEIKVNHNGIQNINAHIFEKEVIR